jgi:flagellar M-ring protein FliF
MPTTNILEQLNSLPTGKKVAALAVLVLSIAGMLLLFSWLQKADYQVLYSNLSEGDAGKIVQELRAKKIPYELGAGGTILVPIDSVYNLRLQLAAEGLPQGSGVGFEIFDKTSITTSEFIQKINYRRALEGELSRTIQSLSEVKRCRVHLVIPKRTIYAWQENEPQTSAAVLLSLTPGRTISNTQAEGIRLLVSSSVEGLNPNSITIMDNKGNLLTKPSDDNAISLSSGQMEHEQSFEKNIATKILAILEPVVGKGKVKAKVSASFDFTRSEKTEERFDPEGAVIKSEQKSTEKSTTGGTGGIPGGAANLPGAGTQQRGSSRGESQKSDEVINYETTKTITRVITSPTTLDRISVATIIDGITAAQQGTVKDPEKYTLRSEDSIKYYEDLVKKAIGFSSERGDEITVIVMPFEETLIEEIPEAETNYTPIIITLIKYLVALAIAVLFLLFIAKPLIKSITVPAPQEIPQPGTQTPPVQGIEGLEMPQLEGQEVPGLEMPQEETAMNQNNLIEWANNNPQQAAGVVKNWLEEK